VTEAASGFSIAVIKIARVREKIMCVYNNLNILVYFDFIMFRWLGQP
jgi:hypothetical protein